MTDQSEWFQMQYSKGLIKFEDMFNALVALNRRRESEENSN